MNTDQLDATILIVDDEAANIRLLERLLGREGYRNLASTTDARQAIPLFLQQPPDLLLLDLHMPHLSGFELLEQVRAMIPPDNYLPILVLTADATLNTRQKALSMGASDFLTKPLERVEVLLRIRNLLETRFLHRRLQEYNQTLEARVAERTHDLEQARLEILRRLARAAEYRDYDTGQHTQRVGQLSAQIAQALGLPEPEVALLHHAAQLHDVGKIGISDSILLKPGKLTAEEFEQIKSHTVIGAQILSGSAFDLLQRAEQIALAHHERWDGGGYPQGLAGQAIPIGGRIVALADVLDALTNERPYKRAWTLDEACEEIKQQRARQFDPEVVDAFLGIYRSLR